MRLIRILVLLAVAIAALALPAGQAWADSPDSNAAAVDGGGEWTSTPDDPGGQ